MGLLLSYMGLTKGVPRFSVKNTCGGVCFKHRSNHANRQRRNYTSLLHPESSFAPLILANHGLLVSSLLCRLLLRGCGWPTACPRRTW